MRSVPEGSHRIGAAAALAIVVAALVIAAPGQAITYGTVDTAHTNVGSILVDYPGFGWIQWCSGTLISARVFLTAGHCTFGLEPSGIGPARMRVSFAVDLFARGAKWLAVESFATHPEYAWTIQGIFGPTSDPRDVGIVVLAKPVRGLAPARLAPVGFLDGLAAQGMLKGATFAVVGYGITETYDGEGVRRIASSEFLNLHRAWLYMSQNVHTGDSGTCSGDSGGPTFYRSAEGEVLVAVTSWGDAPCVATGFAYRVDTAVAQAFLADAIAAAGG